MAPDSGMEVGDERPLRSAPALGRASIPDRTAAIQTSAPHVPDTDSCCHNHSLFSTRANLGRKIEAMPLGLAGHGLASGYFD